MRSREQLLLLLFKILKLLWVFEFLRREIVYEMATLHPGGKKHVCYYYDGQWISSIVSVYECYVRRPPL